MKTTKNIKKSENRTHQCNVCYKVVKGSVYHFQSHLYMHQAVKARFECEICAKQYYRKDLYLRHINIHTGSQKKFTCDYCDRSFTDKRNLINHIYIHDDSYYSQVKKYTCIACNATYCEERLLKYHIRKEHFNLNLASKEQILDKKRLNESWVEPVLESPVCVQMTKVNNNIITIKRCDVIKHEKITEQDCKSNGFDQYMSSVFASSDKSQYSKAICNYCNKEMLKKSLQVHIRERHLKLKQFKCGNCNKRFNRHYQLVDHLCLQYSVKTKK